MSDLISREAAIDALEKTKTVISETGERYVAKINAQQNIALLPSAQPEQRWIPCKETLPEVSYDYLGNWSSPEVILLLNDEQYIRVCNGHFNPVGVFEVDESDGPAFIGRPVEHVIAWMPLPDPYTGGEA